MGKTPRTQTFFSVEPDNIHCGGYDPQKLIDGLNEMLEILHNDEDKEVSKMKHDEVALMRFLIGHQGGHKDKGLKPSNAVDFYKARLVWEKQPEIAKLIADIRAGGSPCSLDYATEWFKLLPSNLHHGFTKKNEPIKITSFGKWQFSEIKEKFSQEQQIEITLYTLEYYWQVTQKLSHEHGRLVRNLEIVNLDNFSILKDLKVLQAWVEELGDIFNHYPEIVAKTVFINAPFALRMIWKTFLALILPARTKAKTVILGGSYQKDLLEMVDTHVLPTWLGGLCAVEEGRTEPLTEFADPPPQPETAEPEKKSSSWW